MSPQILGMLGTSLMLGFSAIGSGIGIGIVGSAAVGAWKRCYKANKPTPMTILALCGMPLSQVIYGFILMQQMIEIGHSVTADDLTKAGLLLGIGVGTGLTMTFTAIAQGKIAAAGVDAIGETGKGFANYLAAIGICETVALFAMVFSMMALG